MNVDNSQYDFWEYMRRGSIYPLYADYCLAWTSLSSKYYNYSPKIAIAYFSNDTVFFRVCRKETMEGGEILCKSLLNDKNEFKEFVKLWNECHNNLSNWLETTKISNQYSFEYYIIKINEFSSINKEVQAIWSAKEYIDAFFSNNNIELKGESFSFKESKMLDTIFNEFKKIENSVWIENNSILNLRNKIFSQSPSVKLLVSAYLKKYYWTGTTYAEILYKDELSILNLYKNKVLNQEFKKTDFSFLNKNVSIFNDELFILFEKRKELLLKSHFKLHKIYEKLGQSFGLSANQAKWITPTEWLTISDKKKFKIQEITEKMHCSFIECLNGDINWVTGKDAFQKELEFRKANFNLNHNAIKGSVVFSGYLEGEAIIIKDKIELPNNNKKYILITGMTTPDYLHILNRAIAVITDEGGVTCHASIICRELNIPCIVGTKLATKIFSNGDIIKIENDTISKIKIREQIISTNSIIQVKPREKRKITNSEEIEPSLKFVYLSEVDNNYQYEIGSKAQNLAFLIKNNFCQSNGYLLYGNSFNINNIEQLIKKSNFNPNKTYAIRSSAIDEDSIVSSKAGFYKTFLNVNYNDLFIKIIECANEMLLHQNFCGVIIQEMFPSKISGVAFTSYISTGREDLMLIEASWGIGAVVDGNKTPQRYICKKQSLKLERLDINDTIEPNANHPVFKPFEYDNALIKPETLKKLCRILRKIELIFNYSCDIEWAIDDMENINILQCRPIITNQ